MTDILINDDEIQRALARLVDAIGDIDPVLSEIGFDLVESTQRRFGSLTGPDKRLWPVNSEITRERKGRSKPPLTDEGTLGEEIQHQLLGNNTLSVGSNLEYAAMQQFGGTRAQFPNLWGDIPPRPFIGLSDDDRENILDILTGALREAVD